MGKAGIAEADLTQPGYSRCQLESTAEHGRRESDRGSGRHKNGARSGLALLLLLAQGCTTRRYEEQVELITPEGD
jgi:hypothetical protein